MVWVSIENYTCFGFIYWRYSTILHLLGLLSYRLYQSESAIWLWLILIGTLDYDDDDDDDATVLTLIYSYIL
jgi:hypothetical protein